jgi:hypothetical protein
MTNLKIEDFALVGHSKSVWKHRDLPVIISAGYKESGFFYYINEVFIAELEGRQLTEVSEELINLLILKYS